jgi:hypothetical protein
MKFDLTKSPMSDTDTPLLDEQGKVVTFRTLLINIALADVDQHRQPVQGGEKIKRYEIYRKLKGAKSGSVDLRAEDVALLKEGALAFPTLIAGEVRAFLDPVDAKE